MARIVIENLSKDFVTASHRTVHAVSGANLTVEDGEVVVIIGPSGSGKSTLLRTVNKLEPVTEGRIFIDDDEVTGAKADIRKIREEVGMVFQSFNLFPHLTALENITLAPIKVKKIPKKEAQKRGMSCSMVGLRKANVHLPALRRPAAARRHRAGWPWSRR